MVVKCAECECTPTICNRKESPRSTTSCDNCTNKGECCCLAIHVTGVKDQCCNDPSCTRIEVHFSGLNPQTKPTISIQSPQPERGFGIRSFLFYAKGLYAAALGIEILCIAAAEIGENTSLYLFGFNAGGIAIGYVMGYALAGFTTFITILGRYGNKHTCDEGNDKQGIDSCCSVLEQDSTQRFVTNLITTFSNFASGFRRLFSIRNQTGIKTILKSSLIILITTESVCILTAETVDLIFYQYSILLSVPLALLAGAFTVVAPAAYKKSKQAKANAKTAGRV
ncbi:MAG: hypothetical protein ACRD8Z_28335 [Nitrososphaeraceae archaeon]